MSEWKEVELGDLIEVKYGKDHKKLQDGNIPCFGSGGIMRYVDRHIYDKKSILIPRKGSLNNILFQDKPFWTVDTMFWSKVDEKKVYPKFLYYQLSLIDYTNLNVGSAVPSLTVPVINEIDVNLPSLPEQKAIASVLSSLDDKIDLLHRQNKTLEAMAETLFREWFVEGVKDGFKAGYLSEFVEDTFGGDWGKEDPEDDYSFEVKCIRGTDIGDLQKGLAQKCPTRFVKESKFKRVAPRNGDLIIEISGGTEGQSTGRTIYVDEGIINLFEAPLLFSNFCRLIRLKNPNHLYFVYLYISHLYDFGHFFNLQNGSSGIRNLDYKAFISEYPLMFPIDKEVIISFNELVKGHFVKINKNKTQILSLESLRDTLLPKFMNGEIRIPTDG